MEPLEGKMTGTQSLDNVSTKQQRIAMLAQRKPGVAVTSLSHHIDIEWLKEAYQRTRKGGAVGIDGQTAKDYEARLEENLQQLLDRAKGGTYRAPPVKRVHIPKGDGKSTRPIGIPTFEDKVLQRAAVMALEPIYEQDFMDCSYGFRPRRSAHQALASFWKQMMAMGGGWVVEVDIRKFFDTLDHRHLQAIVRQRVRDGVLLRLIGKWLNAGVMEDGALSYPEAGTPQGGVISPLLANVYLHEVLDTWFERDVKPRLLGRAFLVRYADDFVIGFSSEADARRVMDVLPKRMGKYGLTLHPEKTRLIRFHPPRQRRDGGIDEPGTFDLLGFTHLWTKSRKGRWYIRRKTAKGRLRRSLTAIAQWCRSNRHRPIREQHKTLSQKLRGHFGYYGITGNAEALARFRRSVECTWYRWLARRSWRPMSWERFSALQRVFPLPPAIAVHSVLRRAAKSAT
ncbi:MAG TPA: group II intron reverse transcriptase/maturase [Solirubrobacterales bacterium]|nr:group II intron reverse transcriptase/maturase [Solirubrobacterales bacterium]